MPKRHSDYAQKHSIILEASVDVMSRQGYAGTTIEDIARASDVTKGNIYHYFDSKAQIFWAIHDLVFEKIYDNRREMGVDAINDPVQRLKVAVQAHVKAACEHARIFNVVWSALFDELARNPEESEITIVKARRAYEELFVSIMDEIPHEELATSLTPKLAVKWMLMSINAISVWYRKWDPISDRQNIEALSTCILKGILRDKYS